MARTAIKIYLKSAIEGGFNFIKRRFRSLNELNNNFHAQRRWIFEKMEKKADFKRRLARVLEILKMHSCKYIGISFLTENALCEAYKAQYGESISKRTVGTCVKHLREIGFASTIQAKREDGRQTANIVIIERFRARGELKEVQSAGASEERAGEGELRFDKLAHKGAENLRTKKTTSPLKTTTQKIKERIANNSRLLNFVPQWFRDLMGCCSRNPKDIYEYWKVSKNLTKRTFGTLMGADELQSVIGSAIREFYLSAKAAARGKFRMNNPFGFFHTVLEAAGHAHLRKRAQEKSNLLYNWLEN